MKPVLSIVVLQQKPLLHPCPHWSCWSSKLSVFFPHVFFLKLSCLLSWYFSAPTPTLHTGQGSRLLFATLFGPCLPWLEAQRCHLYQIQDAAVSGLGVLPGFSVFIDSSFQKKPISCSVLPRGRASQSAGRGAAVAV